MNSSRQKGLLSCFAPKVAHVGVVACVLGAAVSLHATNYDESVQGDLSTSPGVPTHISLTLGDNEIHGSTGRQVTGGPVDRDFFEFTIPAGQQLTSITPLRGTTFAGAGSLSFIGLVSGSNFGATVPTTAGGLLGYHHYGPSEIGTDILDDIGTGAGSIGFSAPLGPGNYAIWIQETAVASVNYGFNLHKTQVSVPESGPGLFAGAGALALTLAAARRLRGSSAK
jgi:hypothetical protein